MKTTRTAVSLWSNFAEVLKVGHFGVPLFTLAAGAILLGVLLTDPLIDFSKPQSPGLWPRAMIIGLMSVGAITLLWAIYDAWFRRYVGPQSPKSTSGAARDEQLTEKAADIVVRAGVVDADHDDRRMVLGIIGVVGYAAGVQIIGFLFATLAIIVYWMVIWRVRSIVRIILTSTIGTGCILAVFLKIAYLPLPKGRGIFEDATIYLYRILKLF